MSDINIGSSVATFQYKNRYTFARLFVVLAARPLAATMEAIIARGRAAVAKLDAALDVLATAYAAHDEAEMALDDALQALGRAALDAAGGHEEARPYAGLFERAPSEYVKLADVLVSKGVKEVERKLCEMEGPLAERRATIAGAREAFESTGTAVVDAEAAEGAARGAIAAWKEDVNLAREKIESELHLLFPGNRRRVRSFFRKSRRNAKRTKKGEAAE